MKSYGWGILKNCRKFFECHPNVMLSIRIQRFEKKLVSLFVRTKSYKEPSCSAILKFLCTLLLTP